MERGLEAQRAANQIRDVVENRQGQSDFGDTVDIVVPEYCHLLMQSKPLFIAEKSHQKLRKLILETIFRLPATDQAWFHFIYTYLKFQKYLKKNFVTIKRL